MGNLHTLSIYVKHIQKTYSEDQKDINHFRKSNIQSIYQLSTKIAMVKYNLNVFFIADQNAEHRVKESKKQGMHSNSVYGEI